MRILPVVSCVLLLCGAIGARAAVAPTQVIQTLSEQMIEALRDNREVLAKDPGRIHALVDRIAIPHIDVDFFSRYVLGHQWREATPAQRARFLAAFKAYVIDSYADVLLRYKDQTVQVFPLPRGEAGQRIVTVHSEIKGGAGQPIAMDYRLHQSREGWKICDIVIEGVSLGISYRNNFAEAVARKGLDPLIAELEHHNAEHGLDAPGVRH